jgi:glycosyltransferase involved in cell wall biosynthesis
MSAPVPDVSVVAPLFNEEAVVGELVERITATLGARGVSFEIVLVPRASPRSRARTPRCVCAR